MALKPRRQGEPPPDYGLSNHFGHSSKLYASYDKRVNAMVIKTYSGQHYDEGTEQPFSMLVGESQPLLSQLTVDSQIPFSQLAGDTMIARLDAEASQVASRRVEPVGLPDSSFIMSNLPAARPMPPSTATKTGRAVLTKGKGTASTAKKTKKTNKPDQGKA